MPQMSFIGRCGAWVLFGLLAMTPAASAEVRYEIPIYYGCSANSNFPGFECGLGTPEDLGFVPESARVVVLIERVSIWAQHFSSSGLFCNTTTTQIAYGFGGLPQQNGPRLASETVCSAGSYSTNDLWFPWYPEPMVLELFGDDVPRQISVNSQGSVFWAYGWGGGEGGCTVRGNLIVTFDPEPTKSCRVYDLEEDRPFGQIVATAEIPLDWIEGYIVGEVTEMSGVATVLRLGEGVPIPLSVGSVIQLGDVVETGANGSLNMAFIDDTSFAISEDSRLGIDDYVFDSGVTDQTSFSVLKGMFVFTSGLIGQDDPDDVEISTPIGSVGIRGDAAQGQRA